MPPAQTERPAPRSKSRHKGRKMVAFKDDAYQMATLVAMRGNRPLARQIRIVIVNWLRSEGAWPPTPALLDELERLQADTDA